MRARIPNFLTLTNSKCAFATAKLVHWSSSFSEEDFDLPAVLAQQCDDFGRDVEQVDHDPPESIT